MILIHIFRLTLTCPSCLSLLLYPLLVSRLHLLYLIFNPVFSFSVWVALGSMCSDAFWVHVLLVYLVDFCVRVLECLLG